MPESLQLLHSKATAAPQPGAGAAIKNLSAHIAQGMLFQAAHERARLQQQQQQQQHEQQQQQGSQQYQQGGVSEGGGGGGHTQPCQQQADSMQPLPAPSSLAAAAAASAPGQSPPWQACLSVLQRLEVKVDDLAADVTAGLQQLDRRLAKLEAACAGGAASHSQSGDPGTQQS